MKKHDEPVTACAWLPDGKWFISGSQDKNTYLWVKKIYIHLCIFLYIYISFFLY
jgi:WD40 repeat protein